MKKSSSWLKWVLVQFSVKAVLDIMHKLTSMQTIYQNCLVGTARLACIRSQCYVTVSQNSNFEIHNSPISSYIVVAQFFQNALSKGRYVRHDCVMQ